MLPVPGSLVSVAQGWDGFPVRGHPVRSESITGFVRAGDVILVLARLSDQILVINQGLIVGWMHERCLYCLSAL